MFSYNYTYTHPPIHIFFIIFAKGGFSKRQLMITKFWFPLTDEQHLVDQATSLKCQPVFRLIRQSTFPWNLFKSENLSEGLRILAFIAHSSHATSYSHLALVYFNTYTTLTFKNLKIMSSALHLSLIFVLKCTYIFN